MEDKLTNKDKSIKYLQNIIADLYDLLMEHETNQCQFCQTNIKRSIVICCDCKMPLGSNNNCNRCKGISKKQLAD